MLIAYFNYPNSRISVHSHTACSLIQAKNKTNQRMLNINLNNIEEVLEHLRNKELQFASHRDLNDAWLYIDLRDSTDERSLVETIQNILGSFYKPFADAVIEHHC